MNHLIEPKDMSDAEREAHIVDCGRLMEKEMDAGNREAALGWLQAMQEAIKSRSSAQVARMEAARGLEPCETFVELAALDLPALLRRQAA